MTYDPKSALKILKKNNAMPARKPVGPNIPDAYRMGSRPQPLCFPLMAWLDGAKALPEDILAVPLSSKVLKEHVRPDGGMFLGLFELPDQPASGIVVFGDPLMSRENAIAVSIHFRRRLTRIAQDMADKDDALMDVDQGKAPS